MLDRFSLLAILGLTLIIVLVSCSNQDGNEVTVPVVAECESYFTKLLEMRKDSLKLKIQYARIAYPIPTHPDIKVVVKISTPYEIDAVVLPLLNRAFSECYGDSLVTMNIDDENFGVNLIDQIRFNSAMGIDKYYMKVEEGKLYMYFKAGKREQEVGDRFIFGKP